MPAPLLQILFIAFILAGAGVVLYGLDHFPGINATLKEMARAVIYIVAGLWVLLILWHVVLWFSSGAGR